MKFIPSLHSVEKVSFIMTIISKFQPSKSKMNVFSILVRIAIFLLLTLLVLAALVFIIRKDVCRDEVIECLVSPKSYSPVCGTDGITYSSICQVISKQCRGESITVNYGGPCKDKTPCFTAFRRAAPFLQPTCNPDGTFAPIQCHLPSSYCWCVTPTGDRLQETLTQYQKPLCPPSPNNTPLYSYSALVKRNPSPTPHRSRQSFCNQKNYHKFTKNLRKTFEIEYNRTKPSTTIITNDTIIIWKFNHLDTNSDGYLDESEYDVLVRLAEKGVTPKKCARILPQVCDVTNDMNISLNEWSTCLMNSTSDLLRRHKRGKISNELSSAGEPWSRAGNNCTEKREVALNYKKQTDQKTLFVPECTDEGGYQPVQCLLETCWCADEDGVLIDGTPIKNVTIDGRPNCQESDPVPTPAHESVLESVPVERVMYGCRKGRLEDLIKNMKEVMMSKFKDSREGQREGGTGKNEEERAVRWMFFTLDSKKDNFLQRGNEWRSIRALLPDNRCAKKLPKFCDVNKDDKISIDEWFGCLNIVKTEGKVINPLDHLH